MKVWNIFEQTIGALADPDEPVLIDTGICVKSFEEVDGILSELPGNSYRILPSMGGNVNFTKADPKDERKSHGTRSK